METKETIKVYTITEGKLIEDTCEVFGYPNFTHSGDMMYENTHFRFKNEAIDYGIKEHEAGVWLCERSVTQLKNALKEEKKVLTKERNHVKYLNKLQLTIKL